MKLHARPYRDSTDFERMRQLVMAGQHSNILASYMHPGCLDWDTHCPPDEQENRRNLRLWERIGAEPPALEAWAICSRHEGTFDLFVSSALYGTPEHEIVMDEYVVWAEARAREIGAQQISPFWAMKYDTVLERLVKARGFDEVPFDPAPPLFERSLDDLPAIAPPAGFTVQGVGNLDDGRLRAQVTHGAFRSGANWDDYWATYARFIGSAVYDGARDLFVRSPDGRGASACTIWFDPVNAVGLFEPVATHPDFQGQGLGKAVMAEGLRRMQAAGMRRAIVGFDPTNAAALALYTSLGFRASGYFAGYRKPVAAPPFLDAREIAHNCAEARLDEAATKTLLDFVQRISAAPDLYRAISVLHHTLYETSADFKDALRQADAAFGSQADLLHSLLILDSMRLIREKQQARGVPGEIARAVNQRHAVSWLNNAVATRGSVGILDWPPSWVRLLGTGELYRLGRLEFILYTWDLPFRAYTNRHTHETIVLAEDGVRFTPDGYRAGTPTWASTLVDADDAVIGTPIAPRGYALPQPVRLPHAEWQLALRQGDDVLDMHVPGEGALTLEALRDAMAQAEAFFRQFYPERPFAAYVCSSWLFSPQLEAMLPPESNILRWQREGYLAPDDAGTESVLEFTFGASSIDLATAPQDTRLRRAIIEHLSKGGELYCGNFLLLHADAERFGAQPYREASEQAIARVRAEP